MITSIRLVNFKNFADETLRTGPFTVIAGANASGKSNIRDAFRFLHGIGRGYTLAEIMGGKYGSGGKPEWTSIRGAPREVIRVVDAEPSTRFALEVQLESDGFHGTYHIEVARREGVFHVVREWLDANSPEPVYTSHPRYGGTLAQGDEAYLSLRMAKTGSQKKQGPSVTVRSDQPALTQIGKHKKANKPHKDKAQKAIDALASMRFFDLIPDLMRRPSFPGQTTLSDVGENLSGALQKICSDPRRKDDLLGWIRELTPMDVTDFEFAVDSAGFVQLMIHERNRDALSAYSASDGTLRFLAVLSSLLAEDSKGLYFFEEIDNGIHPSRQWLLLELIEKQTAKGNVQVVATTHSPALLTFVNDSTFRNTSVVGRREDAADAIIRPVAELPNAEELRKTAGLGRLLTGGWMENVLAFTEQRAEDEEVGA